MIHILKSDLLDHEVDVLQNHFWCHFEETMTLQEPWHGRTAALFKIDQRNRQERSRKPYCSQAIPGSTSSFKQIRDLFYRSSEIASFTWFETNGLDPQDAVGTYCTVFISVDRRWESLGPALLKRMEHLDNVIL